MLLKTLQGCNFKIYEMISFSFQLFYYCNKINFSLYISTSLLQINVIARKAVTKSFNEMNKTFFLLIRNNIKNF